MVRGDRNRWHLLLTQWTPREGKRKRGRPQTRWIDEILRYVGPHLTSHAQNKTTGRVCWKPMPENQADRVVTYLLTQAETLQKCKP